MNKIRDLRKSRRLTQKELADAAGLSIDTISRYERGDREPRITEMGMIAKALGCPAKDILMDDVPDPTPPPTQTKATKGAKTQAGAIKAQAVNE